MPEKYQVELIEKKTPKRHWLFDDTFEGIIGGIAWSSLVLLLMRIVGGM